MTFPNLYALFTISLSVVFYGECSKMRVGGSGYVKFDLLGTNTSIVGTTDTLILRFKTIEPHGLLFYAHGVGYVSLELYHCKLRYTINMAQEFSFLFGDTLCDNQWHSVHITRDAQKLTVYLDKEAPKFVTIKMAERFRAQRVLRFNIRLYVGGTWKKTNEMRKTKLVRSFVGCLADVTFNAYNLISQARDRSKGFTIHGDVSFACKPVAEFKPFGFPNSRAYLEIPSFDPSNVSVALKFRTYDENGILMHRDGPKISVWLYLEKRKLTFEFYVPNEKLLTLSTDSWMHEVDFSDGQWHSVYAALDSKRLTFRVNNGNQVVTSVHAEVLKEGATNLMFENVTYVAGGTYHKGMSGFVGCIRDLSVNGVRMNAKALPKDVKARNVDLGKCATRSLCHPNSCQFKSRCEQRSNNFTCHCERFYSGRYCETPLFQSTCHGYKELGMNEDAYCRLDPDGKGSLAEFEVLCNMTGTDAVTIVNHTRSMRQVKVREEAYTFSHSARSWGHKLDYGIELKAVRAMVMESKSCRQYVEFNCINTTFLTPRDKGSSGAYWASHSGIERHYWSGSGRTGVTCACGETRTCHDLRKNCNCDTGDGVWRQDSAYITNKDHLPVAVLFFPKSAGSSTFTVGPLECFGRKSSLTRETEKRKFFDIACQPLVTKPPPVFPGLKTTSSKQSTQSPTEATQVTTQKNTPTTGMIMVYLSTKTGLTGNTDPTSENATKMNDEMSVSTTMPKTNGSSSLAPVNKKDLDVLDVSGTKVDVSERESVGWLFLLVIAGSSLVFIVAFLFLVLVVRNKKKNGVWFKGLFMLSKEAQFPKIEIYRHSLVDAPDILHHEDFKNTKVVDVDFHDGHFVAAKNGAKKKRTVKFSDLCETPRSLSR